MSIKYTIETIAQNFLLSQGYKIEGWIVEKPKDKNVADFAVNFCFLLSRELKKNPIQIAEDLCLGFQKSLQTSFQERVEVFALRGFLNIKFGIEFYYNYLVSESFCHNFEASKKNILLEFVSANPTGPLHIGHGRWAVLGDSLRRIMQFVGMKVQTEFYINDAGAQINNLLNSVKARKEGKEIPSDGYAGAYVQELISVENPVIELISRQKLLLSKFRVDFDNWYSENLNLRQTTKISKALDLLGQKGFTYQKDGALFFKSTAFGDDKDRVLIKQDGELTYFAVDIAYHYEKVVRGFDLLINIWGADHHGYIPRIKASLQALVGNQAEIEILLGQLVSLYRDGQEVRMSKRTGEMITLEEVIEEIGVDATRFFLVMKPASTAIDFDLSLAVKQSSDNPVYYIQYAHARMNSILNKIDVIPSFVVHPSLNDEDRDILRYLVYFEDEILLIANSREPHRLATYLMELADKFHSYYHKCKVIGEDQELTAARAAIIVQAKKVFKIGLELLGISSPESM